MDSEQTESEDEVWLTKNLREKMKGMNYANKNNSKVFYDDEEMTIDLILKPIDGQPPEYVLQDNDGEHIRVPLDNKSLTWYKPGTVAPKIESSDELLDDSNIDYVSQMSISDQLQKYLAQLPQSRPPKKKSGVSVLLDEIEQEEEKTKILLEEIALYKKFFGSKMFDGIEDNAGTPTFGYEVGVKRENEFEDNPRRKVRISEAVKPHILKALNTPRKSGKELYLTFNCLTCFGIYTSRVDPQNETVNHKCSAKIVHQAVRNVSPAQVQCLQVAVV